VRPIPAAAGGTGRPNWNPRLGGLRGRTGDMRLLCDRDLTGRDCWTAGPFPHHGESAGGRMAVAGRPGSNPYLG
jgi:hypothetical protein